MEKISKQEILDIVKKNGMNEEMAEQLLEMLAKSSGGVIVDVIKLVAEKTENKWDDMLVGSAESKMREMINDIEVSL